MYICSKKPLIPPCPPIELNTRATSGTVNRTLAASSQKICVITKQWAMAAAEG